MWCSLAAGDGDSLTPSWLFLVGRAWSETTGPWGFAGGACSEGLRRRALVGGAWLWGLVAELGRRSSGGRALRGRQRKCRQFLGSLRGHQKLPVGSDGPWQRTPGGGKNSVFRSFCTFA